MFMNGFAQILMYVKYTKQNFYKLFLENFHNFILFRLNKSQNLIIPKM